LAELKHVNGINSPAIDRIQYHSDVKQLDIWFCEKSGPYTFFGVPPSVYDGIVKASCSRTYFKVFILDAYWWSRYGYIVRWVQRKTSRRMKSASMGCFVVTQRTAGPEPHGQSEQI
jgi:hypothetical protein